MATVIVVVELHSTVDRHNLLNLALDGQKVPAEVREVLESVWQMDVPKSAGFLARLRLASEQSHHSFAVFEIVPTSAPEVHREPQWSSD